VALAIGYAFAQANRRLIGKTASDKTTRDETEYIFIHNPPLHTQPSIEHVPHRQKRQALRGQSSTKRDILKIEMSLPVTAPCHASLITRSPPLLATSLIDGRRIPLAASVFEVTESCELRANIQWHQKRSN
jgi:hypothetical protein